MAADPLPLMDCRIVFRCPECSETVASLPLLEKHLWQFHLNDFAYRCALCGLPALSTDSLREHYAQTHEPGIAVEFKRKIDQELCLKDVISRSITVEVDVVHGANGPAELPEQQWTQNKTEQHAGALEPQGSGDIEADMHHNNSEVVDPNNEQPGPSHSADVGESQEVSHDEDPAVYASAPTKSELDSGNMEISQEFLAQLGLQLSTITSKEPGANNQDDSVALLAVGELEPVDASYNINPASNDGSWPENADTFSYVDEHGKPITLEEITQSIESLERVVRVNRKPATYYKCDVCDKVIKYPSKIAEHLRSHTGEKPFQCRFCGHCFTQRGALNCHVRLHTGERPYKCSWDCGKSFVSSSAQRVHEKVHSGERKYKCNYCPQMFLKKFHLDRHERRHQEKGASTAADNATGIDAAGDYAYALFNTVSDVIDSVHSKTAKQKEDASNEDREDFFTMDEYMSLSV